MKPGSRLRLYRTFRYITTPPRQVFFPSMTTKPQKVLFLFPIKQHWLEESTYIYGRLKESLPDNTTCLAVATIYRDIIEGPVHSLFYFPMNPNKPERIQMDVILARFHSQLFDTVVNLEPDLNFQIARLMSVIKASRRIGFAGPHADCLYNIQIQADLDGNLNGAYEQILTLCSIGND